MARRAERPIAWSIEDSAELYQVNAWGKGYFCVNPAGHLVVRPDMNAEREIDLFDVVQGLKERELTTPVVVRFSDILAHRLKHLHDAFAQAIAENDYQNRYTAVFPIKVNQQRLVVEEVYRYGQPFGFGLEVGSKPELLSVMTMTADSPERLIVCNGFKDDSYLEAVIIATKLGRTIIPVVENFSELPAILRIAEKYNVRPRIGVRVKLASEGSGKWRDSAGDKSKFGLFITEILEAVEILREKDMLDCLQLVHCHPGSQLQDIRRVKDAINELAHVYAELKLLGAGLQYIDVGGGLGVDYDGSGTNFASSMNYTLNEYANDVVYRIANVCNTRKIAHPMIVSESGRAIAAHHSVLIFNTLGTSALDQFRVTGKEDQENGGELPQPVRDLLDAYRTVTERRVVECYHDAQTARDQVLQMFNLGLLTLRAARPRRAALLGDLRQGARPHAQAGRSPGRTRRARVHPLGHLFLQFLGVPVAARQLGHRPAVPHHADPPAQRAADAQGRAGRHHLRLGREDRPLREPARSQEDARAARHHRAGRVLPRGLPGRRLPGNARRPAQPVRRHARGARALPR